MTGLGANSSSMRCHAASKMRNGVPFLRLGGVGAIMMRRPRRIRRGDADQDAAAERIGSAMVVAANRFRNKPR